LNSTKHPFGLALIYFIGLFVSLALTLALFGLILLLENDPLSTGAPVNTARTVLVVVGAVLILLTLLMTFIGAYLYESNVVLVTSDKITQVLYRNIFDRKISQLSIGDVQDVTVNQVGIFSHIFNFGTLVIETAGEQQNYTFTYVPRPHEASKAIVNAHEENLKQYGN
jgi:uncharacterized membrane protein YdbT with pleckstrin-like domain